MKGRNVIEPSLLNRSACTTTAGRGLPYAPGNATVPWQTNTGAGGSPILAGGYVWTIGGSTLYGFRAGPDGCRYLNFRAQADSTFFTKEDILEARR